MRKRLTTTLKKVNSNPVEKLFLMLAIPFGLLFVFLTPPFQSPDECLHYWREYQLSEGTLLGEKQQGVGGGTLPTGVIRDCEKLMGGINANPEAKVNIKVVAQYLYKPIDSSTKTFRNTPVAYSPVLYIPQTIAVVIGKALNLSVLLMMYLGRLFVLASWLAIIYYAIKLLPFGKWFAAIYALTPMSLFLASSLSAEAFNNSLPLLLVATFVYLYEKNDTFSQKELTLTLLLSFVMGLLKPILVFLPLIFILLPRKGFKDKLMEVLYKLVLLVAAFLPFMLWGYLVKDYVSAYNPLFSSDLLNASKQISWVEHNPIRYLKTAFRTLFVDDSNRLFLEFFGVLGWLDTHIPSWIIASQFTIFVLALMSLGVKARSQLINFKTRLFAAGIIILGLTIVPLSLFAANTPVGYKAILGIQGRYFIPFAPMLVLLFFSKKNYFSLKNLNAFFLFSQAGILFMGIFYLLLRYYAFRFKGMLLILTILLLTVITSFFIGLYSDKKLT